jgi:hypothetical protein
MDWIYEKYLRNEELRKLENECSNVHVYLPIVSIAEFIEAATPESFHYFVNSGTQVLFSSGVGFRYHPNSSQEMYIQIFIFLNLI